MSNSLTNHVFALALGLSAALFSLTPDAPALDEMSGLDLLFWLRGTVQPPPQIVTVGIDRNSSLALNAPDDPARWPRTLHANAVRRLHEAGAALVAFDVFFGESRPGEDEVLAAAMRETGSVVLADFLRLKHLQGDVYVESLERPTPVLATSALATAPFLLAQGAEAERFLTLHGDHADQPTLPLALLQLQLLRQGGASLPLPASGSWPSLAQLVLEKPDVLRQGGMAPGLWTPLRSLAECYSGGRSRYFNHYGPAGTIPRIAYHRLMGTDMETGWKEKVRGKVVLIGFTENFQPNTSDGIYYSPFSPVSSLELAATALANLLEHRHVHPLFAPVSQFLWLLCWGYFLGVLGQSRGVSAGTALIVVAGAAYLAVATELFKTRGLWLPVTLPLFWQVPVALLGCLVGNYMKRSREHRKIHSVIRRFIPVDVASQLTHPESGVHWDGRLTFGVCLASDAGQYTALAERMAPMAVGELMNRYYACVFPVVTDNDGWVSDVIGDAMMAIWTGDQDNVALRRKAILAALGIRRALTAFEKSMGVELPIRMGLHCGEMRVGFVGASDHGEYRALGDTVNTAARLEGLNKLLGTHILVADGVVRDLGGFITRPLGSFLLAGKVQPVSVSELICHEQEASESLLTMLERFAPALSLYQSGEWGAATAAFQQLADEYPEDGPTLFYRETAQARTGGLDGHPPGAAIVAGKTAPAHPV